MIGAKMMAIPSAMNTTPGTIKVKLEDGLSMKPLQAFAIGHIGIGVGFAIAFSSRVEIRLLVDGQEEFRFRDYPKQKEVWHGVSFSHLVTGLSADVHTFNIQWRSMDARLLESNPVSEELDRTLIVVELGD